MFFTNFSKICCSFVQNNFFEKSKMADTIANMLNCEGNSS